MERSTGRRRTRSCIGVREFARIWKDMPKIVFSTTLESVEGNARLVTGSAAEEATGADSREGRAELSISALPVRLVGDHPKRRKR
jgi:hypothetical protein